MVLDYSCISNNVTSPKTMALCLDLVAGNLLFSSVYFGLLVLIVGGWSYVQGPEKGILLGGFFGALIGSGLFFAGLINVVAWGFGIGIFMIGVFATAFSIWGK